MVKRGAGGPYSKKYVMVTQAEIRGIIPRAADECARRRAEEGWTGAQYRECLRTTIRRMIQEVAGL